MYDAVTIISDGAMGTVCSLLLDHNVINTTLWSAFPENAQAMIQDRENKKFLPGVPLPNRLRVTDSEKKAFVDCELIVSAVPCQYIRQVWERLAPHVPGDVPIVSVTKGIENTTLLRPTEILRKITGVHDFAVLSGPCIAPEVARRLPATVVAASDNDELARQVQQSFTTEWFRVYTSNDTTGVELGGAVKNVIALAAGIIDGLGAGDNAKAALLTRGLAEITRLGVQLGARRETFSGLAGMGDLVTTCVSPIGRNRTVGERIGKGGKVDDILAKMYPVVAEGVATTRSVLELAGQCGIEMPITAAVYAVLFEDKDPITAIGDLMQRELKQED